MAAWKLFGEATKGSAADRSARSSLSGSVVVLTASETSPTPDSDAVREKTPRAEREKTPRVENAWAAPLSGPDRVVTLHRQSSKTPVEVLISHDLT